jgi:hypothetical protein
MAGNGIEIFLKGLKSFFITGRGDLKRFAVSG